MIPFIEHSGTRRPVYNGRKQMSEGRAYNYGQRDTGRVLGAGDMLVI